MDPDIIYRDCNNYLACGNSMHTREMHAYILSN